MKTPPAVLSSLLPAETLFMTDGGLETTLVFHDGIELPYFAAFDLLKDDAGTDYLRSYYRRYAEMANRFGLGLVLESPTWRANRDWAEKLGYGRSQLAQANRKGVALMHEIRDAYQTPRTPIVVSGNIGPRGDGYRVDRLMSATEARDYHAEQIGTFAEVGVDLASAFTMNYLGEAIGVTLAARAAGVPAVISFTLETDGRLPSGASLQEAIEQTDAATEVSRPLHDQLRTSDALRLRARTRRALAAAHRRPTRQRLTPQPRGARRGARPGRRQSRRTWQRVPAAQTAAARALGGRWLLRYGSPPRRGDLQRARRGTARAT